MINWINAKEQLPDTFEINEISEENENYSWKESNVVLVKVEGIGIPYSFAIYEIDSNIDGKERTLWVDVPTGWSYHGNEEVIAWAPLSELE